MTMLEFDFFNQKATEVARQLLGKIIRRKYQNHWLSAQIIETEAYFLNERASHASLGFTPKRKALFMPPGTIYMYYARGSDSFNVSCMGKGNAVLIKSALPLEAIQLSTQAIQLMQSLNPLPSGAHRNVKKLCKGQTLLCRALDIKVPDWDQKNFKADSFFIEDIGHTIKHIIQTTRLGIPPGRDEHLPYRFIDQAYAAHCTSNPLTKRHAVDYSIINLQSKVS